MFEIKHGVPAPKNHKDLRKYKFIYEWELDDHVEGLTLIEKEAVGVHARRLGQKTKSRKQEDGSFWVWRVK